MSGLVTAGLGPALRHRRISVGVRNEGIPQAKNIGQSRVLTKQKMKTKETQLLPRYLKGYLASSPPANLLGF